MGDELIVLVTVGSADEASLIAESVTRSRLAACVNIVQGVESVYFWEGKLMRDSELLLIMKTTAARYGELESCIKQQHSYATPEIIAVKIEAGSAPYLSWIKQQTSTPQDAG
jgi:periplasmic divalent cation tolerance protein